MISKFIIDTVTDGLNLGDGGIIELAYFLYRLKERHLITTSHMNSMAK